MDIRRIPGGYASNTGAALPEAVRARTWVLWLWLPRKDSNLDLPRPKLGVLPDYTTGDRASDPTGDVLARG